MDYINFHLAPVLQYIRVFLPFLKNSRASRFLLLFVVLLEGGVGRGGWGGRVCVRASLLCVNIL